MIKFTLLIVLLTVFSQKVSSLECVQCSTDEDGDDCFKATSKSTFDRKCKSSNDDVCIKITTVLEKPNNGPQDRLTDNLSTKSMSRLCGNKRTFERYSDVDGKCDKNTLGGGGYQERCICSGNSCNTSTRIQFAFGVVLSSIIAALAI